MKMDSARRVFLLLKSQRVEFVGDVQENDDFETPRVDRAACVCFAFKSARVS